MRKATNIHWETDGLPARLPVTVDIPNEVHEDDVGDYLSDTTGWLVNSFEIQDVINDPPNQATA